MPKNTVTVSSKGQVVLPLPVRRKLGIGRGQRLALSVQEGSIQLTPVRRLSQMGGTLKGPKGNSEQLVHRLRREWEDR